MDILAKLKAGRSVTKTTALGDIKIGLRLLTEQDHQEAGWAANAMLDKHDAELSAANADIFESEKATQLLMRFVIDPDTGRPVFPDAAEVRATLTRDERNALADAYYDFEREYSPTERTMDEAEFMALLTDVKKKPEPTTLNDLSGALLKRLLLALVSPPNS